MPKPDPLPTPEEHPGKPIAPAEDGGGTGNGPPPGVGGG